MKFLATIAVCAIMPGVVSAAPVQWSSSVGGNDHWYEFVDDFLSFDDAVSFAASSMFLGEAGHLATITSSAEQSFVDALVGPIDGIWLGATDRVAEGEWRWASGPEAGELISYTNWAPFQPDNFNDEDYALMRWNGTGQWNDVLSGSRETFVVEYSPMTPVPLPAGLPLLIGALSFLGLTMRKRSHT